MRQTPMTFLCTCRQNKKGADHCTDPCTWVSGTNAEIIDLFGEEPKILASFTKDTAENYQEGLLELYKKIRPGTACCR